MSALRLDPDRNRRHWQTLLYVIIIGVTIALSTVVAHWVHPLH